MVISVDVELEVYDLLEQVDKLRQRAKTQAAIIGLLARLLKLRGGNLDGDRVPDGAIKSAVLRAIASSTGILSLGTALRIVGISSARYHVWRRREEGCGFDDEPSCPKSFPSQLTRDEVSTMRDFVESETYRHIAVEDLVLCQNSALLKWAINQQLSVCVCDRAKGRGLYNRLGRAGRHHADDHLVESEYRNMLWSSSCRTF